MQLKTGKIWINALVLTRNWQEPRRDIHCGGAMWLCIGRKIGASAVDSRRPDIQVRPFWNRSGA
jgi:hypothetical protein